jgi:hypothetical protein
MTNPTDLNNMLSNTENIVRTFDYSALTSVFYSNSAASQSIQAIPDLRSAGMQTIVNNLEKGIQTIVNPELRVSTNLIDFGTQTDFYVHNSVQTMTEYVNTGAMICSNCMANETVNSII